MTAGAHTLPLLIIIRYSMPSAENPMTVVPVVTEAILNV